MTSQTPRRRQVINSFDEMPSSFESEDAEREFWAAHEFSDALYDQMIPSLKDVADYWPVELRAIDVVQVELPLSICRKHLSYIRRGADKSRPAPSTSQVQHAVAALTFAASAIEAGLNAFLLAPVEFVEDETLRSYLGGLAAYRARHLATNDKLSLVEEAQGNLCDASLWKTIRELLGYRDFLVHGMPASSHLPIPAAGTKQATRLFYAEFRNEDVEQIQAYYEATKEFLRSLGLAPHRRKEATPKSRSKALRSAV